MVAVGELLAVAKVGSESGCRREALRASSAAAATNRRGCSTSLFWDFCTRMPAYFVGILSILSVF